MEDRESVKQGNNLRVSPNGGILSDSDSIYSNLEQVRDPNERESKCCKNCCKNFMANEAKEGRTFDYIKSLTIGKEKVQAIDNPSKSFKHVLNSLKDGKLTKDDQDAIVNEML